MGKAMRLGRTDGNTPAIVGTAIGIAFLDSNTRRMPPDTSSV
jgi:hypothetical protein